MKTKSTIKLLATALIAAASIGSTVVNADAQIIKDKDRDLIKIISDPYATFAEADKALNSIKDKYLADYGDYRGGVNPTEDLKHYEAYAILDSVSLSKKSADSIAEKIAKELTITKTTEEVKPEVPAETTEEVKPENPAKTTEEVKPEVPAETTEEVKPENPAKTTEEVKSENPDKTTAAKTSATKTTEDSQKLKELPNTGTAESSAGVIGTLLLSVVAGFFTFKKRGS